MANLLVVCKRRLAGSDALRRIREPDLEARIEALARVVDARRAKLVLALGGSGVAAVPFAVAVVVPSGVGDDVGGGTATLLSDLAHVILVDWSVDS